VEQMELPFVIEFMEEERVMILSKSMGDPLGRGYACDMFKGQIALIEGVKISDGETNSHIFNCPPKGTKYYTVNGGLFLAGDLRRAPK